MEPEVLDLIVDLHLSGKRQGPGSPIDTKLALALCRLDSTQHYDVADIGCGTGASTLVLANELNASITAIDFADAFLAELSMRAKHQGVASIIETLCAPMEALPMAPNSFDLIWAEGAIYNMGFSAGLTAWRPMLKTQGLIALSEISWTTHDRPAELTQYWESAYPEITTVAGNLDKLEQAGYHPLGHFILPPSAWRENYYVPLQDRFADFLNRHDHSELARAIIAEEQKEIALYDRFGDFFSYGFYVAQKTD